MQKVIIIAHGTPNELSFNGESVTISDIASLTKKEMGTLILSSCNSGLKEELNNLAITFMNSNQINEVRAFDGDIVFIDAGGKINRILDLDGVLSPSKS